MTNARSSRLALSWARVRDSLWLVPSIAVLAGAALAIVAVEIPTPRPDSRLARLWLFGSGADGARGVLTAIAGSLITVTATVFSVTIVALQLASSQFTPRLLGSFVADRVNQLVLGIFIGTFTYTLLVLRTIHAANGTAEAFVPQVGVTLALALLLVSIAALIVFIDHAAQSIRASVILHRETQRTSALVDELFPANVGRPATGDALEEDGDGGDGDAAIVTAGASGYLQSVHADALWRLGERLGERLTIRMELHVGAFVFPGKPLASVRPGRLAGGKEVARAVRDAFVLGPERTPEQDVEFGLIELSDIAVKALSPGINDPTTAIHCIDRLTELLARIGSRPQPRTSRVSPDGRVHLRVSGTPFERLLGLAFDQIRHFGAENPTIAKKLLEALLDLGGVVRSEARPALRAQVTSVVHAARRTIDDPSDLAAVERLAAQALAATGGGADDEAPTG